LKLIIPAEVDALAEIFHQSGVGVGSFVAVFMSNSPEMVFTIIALSKLGAVPAMINIALRSEYFYLITSLLLTTLQTKRFCIV
jgi:acyl-CoA synthetase (AMP-forming)/AMP-acid ligase II